jgi:7-cyano-7-deazaguanine synthase
MSKSITDDPSKFEQPVGHLYCGIHSDDAAGFAYPDCTPEWFGSQANAIFTGTYGRVRLIAPLLWMDKTAVIQTGEDHGVNWPDTWSCYKGGDLHCGTCPTCRSRREGFIKAEIEDPTSYAA